MMRKYLPCWTMYIVLLAAIGGVSGVHAGNPEKVVFLHFHNMPAVSRVIEDMAAVINRAHPQFKVTPAKVEHESYKTAIQAMLAGGNPPDLFEYWSGERTQALVDAGYLEALDDIWREVNGDNRFSRAISRVCTYNNHKYTIPLTQYYVAFFYNVQIFRKHGLTPPQTWPAFLTLCQQLKTAGVTPIALGSRERWPAQFWFDYLLLRTAGPEYRQKLMQGKAAYTDAEVRRVFALWKDILDQGFIDPNAPAYSFIEAGKLVHIGQAAMTLMGNWMIAIFDGELGWRQERDYDFFPFPILDDDVPLTAVGTIDAVALPRGRSAAAKAVLPHFSDIEPQKIICGSHGAISPNQNMPADFYTPMQRRIRKAIRETPHWAFNYDLATPPPVADVGLDSFAKFVKQPDRYLEILEQTEKMAKQRFREK